MIRKIYLQLAIVILGCSTLIFNSCNYLDIDQYITDMQSIDTVFQKKESTEKFLYNVYSYLPNQGSSWEPESNGTPWVISSDEAFLTVNSGKGNYFSNNTYNATLTEYSKWKKYYQAIRVASTFLKRVPECKELTPIQLREYTGEAQFLKAYFYFELMKQYGPVCITPEFGFTLEQPIDQILLPRSKWDECVNHVTDLLEKAAKNLPDQRPSSDFGKPTAGAAQAVLSRLLLYSASPLFNGNTSYANFVDKNTKEPYINQNYDDSKWAKAAIAALKIIQSGKYELTNFPSTAKTPALPANVTSDPDFYNGYPNGANGIDHYLSYINQFNGAMAGSNNKELIFGMTGIGIVKQMAPLKLRGTSYLNVTQKLVDAYYMVNGKTKEEADADYPYTETKSTSDVNFSGYLLKSGTHGWYLNREMRFYATIGFNNAYYYGTSSTDANYKNFTAQFFKDGNCSSKEIFSSDKLAYCMTGYLCNKYLHPEDMFYGSKGGVVKNKVWPEYRLAEIYLNYVEALNEMKEPHTIDGVSVSRSATEIKKYFNLIRYRAGLPGITNGEAENYETVKNLIRHERQIELAWEGHRYFDVRRWKTANVEENGDITGMAVNKTGDEYYRVVKVREVNYAYKNFTQRKNFWPIPYTETTKNINLVQNQGWE